MLLHSLRLNWLGISHTTSSNFHPSLYTSISNGNKRTKHHPCSLSPAMPILTLGCSCMGLPVLSSDTLQPFSQLPTPSSQLPKSQPTAVQLSIGMHIHMSRLKLSSGAINIDRPMQMQDPEEMKSHHQLIKSDRNCLGPQVFTCTCVRVCVCVCVCAEILKAAIVLYASTSTPAHQFWGRVWVMGLCCAICWAPCALPQVGG